MKPKLNIALLMLNFILESQFNNLEDTCFLADYLFCTCKYIINT